MLTAAADLTAFSYSVVPAESAVHIYPRLEPSITELLEGVRGETELRGRRPSIDTTAAETKNR